MFYEFIEYLYAGTDLGGGGGGGRPFSSGIGRPADPKGPPFGTFQEMLFWPTDPKIFLKAPLAPRYTKFEGGARAEKIRLFGQKKWLKTPSLDCFFKVLTAAQKIWPKQGLNNA